jgi:2-polyprenyl-6-methoxyphenol hydroxylase-like FAD-dependent oxidoreductase
MTNTYDVVIVGYGPVGQYLALKLGQAGYSVACLEKWPQPYALPRAVHFDHEIARLLKSVGLDSRTNPIIEPYDMVYRSCSTSTGRASGRRDGTRPTSSRSRSWSRS